MAGHMGDKVRTIQNLEIIKSDLENNLIFIKGSIPGSKNSIVLIKKNVRKINKTTTLEKIKINQASLAKGAVTDKGKSKKTEKKAAPAPKVEKKEGKK